MANATLLLVCPDAKGIVASVARFVYEHGGNIVHADQHTDAAEDWFVQRVEWQPDGFDLEREAIEAAFAEVARRFDMAWSLHFSDHVPRAAVFVSRLGHCLYDVLSRWKMGELAADLVAVISNHRDLEEVAVGHGVPFHHIPVTADAKPEAERAALQLVGDLEVDLVVLARYMQVFSPEFVAEAPPMINIHHSFLPAFAGARPYHQAHDKGVKVIGATAHYVTAELDAGPIIEQDVVRVSHRDDVSDLVRKGRDLERMVLARALHHHLENRVVVYGGKTVVFD